MSSRARLRANRTSTGAAGAGGRGGLVGGGDEGGSGSDGGTGGSSPEDCSAVWLIHWVYCSVASVRDMLNTLDADVNSAGRVTVGATFPVMLTTTSSVSLLNFSANLRMKKSGSKLDMS